MSGGLGAQRRGASPRAEQVRQGMWERTITEVRGRLARIDRGESWAPAQVVRCLRVLVAPVVRR